MKYCKTILDAIGGTPLVRINHGENTADANIFAKLEFMNPGGSVKDRMVKVLVERLAERGQITR
jgi:cystathionine beta-synthase